MPQLRGLASTKQSLATHPSPRTGLRRARREEKASSSAGLAASRASRTHAGHFLYLGSVCFDPGIITMGLQCQMMNDWEGCVSACVGKYVGNLNEQRACIYSLPPPPLSFLNCFTMWLAQLVLSTQQFLILGKWRKSKTWKQNGTHVRRGMFASPGSLESQHRLRILSSHTVFVRMEMAWIWNGNWDRNVFKMSPRIVSAARSQEQSRSTAFHRGPEIIFCGPF